MSFVTRVRHVSLPPLTRFYGSALSDCSLCSEQEAEEVDARFFTSERKMIHKLMREERKRVCSSLSSSPDRRHARTSPDHSFPAPTTHQTCSTAAQSPSPLFAAYQDSSNRALSASRISEMLGLACTAFVSPGGWAMEHRGRSGRQRDCSQGCMASWQAN
eukprot:765512-Hanusia_phi.AAC.4